MSFPDIPAEERNKLETEHELNLQNAEELTRKIMSDNTNYYKKKTICMLGGPSKKLSRSQY